jgi:hypothetical protein
MKLKALGSKSRAILFAALLPFPSLAGSWRCERWVVDAGESQFQVGEKCGNPERNARHTEWRNMQQCETRSIPVEVEVSIPATGNQPARTERRTEYRQQPVCTAVTVQVEVEEWFYGGDGRGNVPSVFRFENGRLADVRMLWDLRRFP